MLGSKIASLSMDLQNGFFESAELKYLISGHSFMDCDHDVGVIEKRRKVSKPMMPKELEDIVKFARITKKKPRIVKITNTFAFEEHGWTKTNVLKKRVNLDSLPAKEEVPRVNITYGISNEKRKDLLAMLPYFKEEYHHFHKDHLQMNSDNSLMEEYAENL
ncbi:hypothetical protein PR048_007599 [Dryococelus australis]|uniref:Uncharacterized protein n=1 Tax=Dryococelus australis TaxID=614101 RepID=A0ABQ9HV43_9NEOP|nr:hypothetical protein PR048_007599 [Dryococelus australis]